MIYIWMMPSSLGVKVQREGKKKTAQEALAPQVISFE
jgi:hypothetical protein